MEEERKDQEQGEQDELKDLEVSEEQADEVKGGLGKRTNPADTRGK
ncbi:MAG: hypothetical protein AABM30_06310 [Actinomycetota bacterium]